MSLRRRLVLVACAAALAVPIAACGGQSKTTFSDSEGTLLDVGPLQYQVQLSRELNPFNAEDQSYLVGVPRNLANLAPGQEWFAVFLQVQNHTKQPQQAATQIRLTDSQHNVYTPIPLASANVFAYAGGTVAAGGQIPQPNTVPYDDPALRGRLLLFKIRDVSYENRPLELEVSGGPLNGDHALVDLDL